VAYADDGTIFVTSVADFAIIAEAISLYERASGAKLNPRKSKALAVGGWCTLESPLGIAYHPSVTIIGVTFLSTTKQNINDSWVRLTTKVCAQARDADARGQCLANRIRYVNTFLLSKIWYTAQILSAPTTYTQKLTTAIAWYIWKGAVFRLPISTLQKPKQMGGWGLTDIASECTALLLSHMNVQSKKDGMATALWLKTWNLTGRLANPPNALKFPTKPAYLHTYAINMAYIMPPDQTETLRCFRQLFTHHDDGSAGRT
jgi:hypothetical protein